jgi:hypothetical protein
MSASAQRASPRVSRGVDVALVVWPSFLAACGASLLFFAAIDPALLRDVGPRFFAGLDREGGYAIGFLFFWGVGAIASALSVYLIRTAQRHDPPTRIEPGQP